jgi:hypothetical protein
MREIWNNLNNRDTNKLQKTRLKDLTNNVVVYEVGKDNDRKQVIIFKIYNKNQNQKHFD